MWLNQFQIDSICFNFIYFNLIEVDIIGCAAAADDESCAAHKHKHDKFWVDQLNPRPLFSNFQKSRGIHRISGQGGRDCPLAYTLYTAYNMLGCSHIFPIFCGALLSHALWHYRTVALGWKASKTMCQWVSDKVTLWGICSAILNWRE